MTHTIKLSSLFFCPILRKLSCVIHNVCHIFTGNWMVGCSWKYRVHSRRWLPLSRLSCLRKISVALFMHATALTSPHLCIFVTYVPENTPSPPYFEANMGRWCLLRHLIYLVQTPLHVWHQQTFPKITNCELPTNISGWLVSTAGIAGRLEQITQEHIHCLFSNL